jgi:hypothetical protein
MQLWVPLVAAGRLAFGACDIACAVGDLVAALRAVAWRGLALVVLLGALAACGGGSGGGGSGSSGSGAGGGTTAPSGLSYQDPPVLVVGQAFQSSAPTVSGTVTSYSVSPALPAGLVLDATTGVISGTPSAATGDNVYQVTASNAAGKTMGDITLEVVTQLYPSATYSFTVGVTARTISPAFGGPTTATWSVAPALPAGLVINPSSGAISGTPTGATAAATYVVTAKTAGGASTAPLTLAVSGAPLLDLGHAAPVVVARFAGQSVLTADSNDHWVLWNYATGQNVANGAAAYLVQDAQPLPPAVDLAGSTVVIQTAAGLEVRAAATGQVEATIATTPSWWKLASDGSYVCAGTASGLTVWSPTGAVLFTRPGNYSQGVAFAAPGQIQVAQGAAGASVIETLPVPAGTSTVGPAFQGQFLSWFGDGGRFLTSLGGTVWVYSSAGVQQDIASLPAADALAGVGDWYWTTNVATSGAPVLTLYAVGSQGVATATYPLYQPALTPSFFGSVAVSGSTVALLNEGTGPATGAVTLLDLSGAAPVATTAPTPVGGLSAFAAASVSSWVAATSSGVVLDGASLAGQPRFFDYGRVNGIVGSTTYTAIATGTGQILVFDATTGAQLGAINQPAWEIAMSADGTVLAAASGGTQSQTQPPVTVTVYSLPGLQQTATLSAPGLTSISLSASGAVLGETFLPTATCVSQTVVLPGTSPSWCGTAGAGWPVMSPDGTLVAESPSGTFELNGTGTTNIYLNGALVTTVMGYPVTWTDDNTLLTFNYAQQPHSIEYEYSGSALYSATGQLLGAAPLPVAVFSAQTLSPTLLYDDGNNTIYSLTTGAASWASGSPALGYPDPAFGPNYAAGANYPSAISGPNVVFQSGNLILAEPY